MKLIVDISDEAYELCKRGTTGTFLINAGMRSEKTFLVSLYKTIANGKPLPKGYGRIMDVDKVIKKMEEREEKLKDDRSIWETAAVETALDMFGKTIIEADKESEA